ncbi:hypothetical protein [Nocardia sp. NPDC005366]|uniref:hypothetical protein n=1 Tax=Nocardia sp. NPDC005366 TaxID=3156878 RepID=UPI0033B57EC6
MQGNRDTAACRKLAARAAVVAIAGVAPVLAHSVATAAPIDSAGAGAPALTSGEESTSAQDGVQSAVRGLDTRAARNDTTRKRQEPSAFELVHVDPTQLRVPDIFAMAPAVAPIEAPHGRVRIGSLQTDVPEWLPSEPIDQINDAAAGAEAGLAQVLDSAGFDPARSDRIAADVLGSAAMGAAIGSTVASPIASVGAVIGAASGFVAGTPFAPAGWLVVTPIGAGIGYGMIAAPFMLVGAAAGAVVGAVTGYVDNSPVAPRAE